VLDPVVDAEAVRGMKEVGVDWTTLNDDAWLGRFVDFWGGAGAWTGLREEVRAEFRRTARIVRDAVTSLAADETPLSAYGAFSFPVLAMTGATSPPVAQRVVERLASGVQRSTKIVVDGAGHFGPVTHAEQVNRIVLAALVEAQRTRSAEAELREFS
jgi:pimeloyl-ACP methyl ester carboxylesterase